MSLGTTITRSCAHCPARPVGVCASMRSRDELTLLEKARSPLRDLPPDRAIYFQGDALDVAFTLVSGWGYLHQTLANGRRQIIRFLLPGDIFGAEQPVRSASHGAETLTQATVCPIPAAALERLRRRPAYSDRRRGMQLRDEDLAMDHLTALGQRNSRERVCHLMLELAVRSLHRPPADGEAVKLPLTQGHLAEALGLTAIHVNRTLRRLAAEHILDFKRGRLIVLDAEEMAELADTSEATLALWAAPSAIRPDDWAFRAPEHRPQPTSASLYRPTL